jgi:hypothetical protein
MTRLLQDADLRLQPIPIAIAAIDFSGLLAIEKKGPLYDPGGRELPCARGRTA